MQKILKSFFSNRDDGIDGDLKWTPHKPKWFEYPIYIVLRPKGWRRLCWWIRNPAHDFTWYVIGHVDCQREGRVHKISESPQGIDWGANNNFEGLYKATYRCTKHNKNLTFRFYGKGKFQTYFGHRHGGAFGFKFNFGRIPNK